MHQLRRNFFPVKFALSFSRAVLKMVAAPDELVDFNRTKIEN